MEIIAVPIEEEVKQSYIDYAMSVIVGRAIPDVRDGLKPVQRRILYAMYDMGLYPEKPFVKSARIVGAVLGYYHPHGDQAVYEALVRMAQDFNMNYPLVVGQGNFGSVDGDPPAAMRYTEAKLSRYAIKLLEDIDKNTVDFVPNFDGSTLEPSVLPSRFPNLLCNGTSGIAVGLATSIPPHNLKEVCQALVELAKNPDLTTQEIMKYIKGPDFPTGGIVENYSELIEFYDKGRGQVRIRAKAHIVEGLLIALRHLDEVIQDIRSSSDIQEAREKLMNKYKLSQAQANAVLDMKLQRLTSLERGKLEEEEKELKEKIEYYTKLVEKEEERIKVFVEETQELAKSFNAPRRTLVEQIQSQEEGALTVVVYAKGRVLPIEDMEEGEEVVNILDVPFTSGLFMVSDKGRVYWIAGSQALRGSLLSLKEAEEKIVGAFVRSHVEGRILLATQMGYVKKIPLVDFEYRAQGMQIIKFSEEGDRIVKVVQAPEDGDVLLFTHRGRLLRFPVGEAPPATVNSKGVQGINLESGDTVVGIRALRDAEYLLVITEDGGIKKISLQEVPQRGRATKGIEVLGSSRERLVDVVPIWDSVELMIATKEGKVFYDKLDGKDIPLSRLDQRAKKRWEIGEDIIVRVVVKG